MRNELETAKTGALAGGRVLEAMRTDMGVIRSKGWATDLVTDADVAAGVAVVQAILERDSAARFVVEEDEVYELAGAIRGSVEIGRASCRERV